MPGVKSPSALFAEELRPNRLLATFEKSIAGRAVAGRDGVRPDIFRQSLRAEMDTVKSKLTDGSFTFTSYKQNLLLKGVGKAPRVVSIATVRDRLLLKAIGNVLANVFPDAHTALAPDLIASLVHRLGIGDLDSFVRIDVMDFYPSVRHTSIEAALRTRIRPGRLIRTVLSAVRTPTVAPHSKRPSYMKCVGVPQGLPISNILAEVAMTSVDAVISSLKNVLYLRYVDDIFILCKAADRASVRDLAVTELKKIGLRCHPFTSGSKSVEGSVKEVFDYLGYKFEWPRVTVRRESVTKLEESITKVFTTYAKYIAKPANAGKEARALERCRLRLDLKITGCVYEGSRRGWISYYSQIRHHQLLHHLDWYVQQEVERHHLTSEVQPKRFVQSYRFAATKRRDTSGFVPNFDNLTADEERDVLDKYFLMDPRELHRMPDVTVAEIFRKKMHSMVVELERDTSRRS